MGDFLDNFKYEAGLLLRNKKNLTSLLLLGIIILGLPIGIRLLKQQQILKSRATESSEPIRFIASDTEFQQTQGNNNTWATTDPNISFNLYSPLGPQGTTAGTPTPTPSPTPGGSVEPTATPVPTSTPAPVQSQSYPIILAKGWNLISIPRDIADSGTSSVASFAGTGDKIYYWNTTYNPPNWDYAIWNGSIWGGSIKNLKFGNGYWVYSAQGGTVNVALKPADSSNTTIPYLTLADGWNMIGYTNYADKDMPMQTYLAGITDKTWKKIYSLDSNLAWVLVTPANVASSNMIRGRGYWICVNSDELCAKGPEDVTKK